MKMGCKEIFNHATIIFYFIRFIQKNYVKILDQAKIFSLYITSICMLGLFSIHCVA